MNNPRHSWGTRKLLRLAVFGVELETEAPRNSSLGRQIDSAGSPEAEMNADTFYMHRKIFHSRDR